jgi:hypothetical protein
MTKIRLWLAYQNLTAKSWRRRAGHPDSSGSRARASSPSKRPLGRSGRNWRNGARAPFRQWTATRQSGTREGWCRIGTPSRISPAEVPGAQTAGSARSGRAARGRGRVRRARRAERAALIEVWPNSAVLTGSRGRRRLLSACGGWRRLVGPIGGDVPHVLPEAPRIAATHGRVLVLAGRQATLRSPVGCPRQQSVAVERRSGMPYGDHRGERAVQIPST